MGKAYLFLENAFPEIPRYSIRKNQIEKELGRLAAACADAAAQVRTLRDRATAELGKDQADIFAAHLLMIEDEDFQASISNRLNERLENIEWVVYAAARQMADKILTSPDPAFRERAADVNDVSHRILGQLLSINKASLAELDSDIILVAHDLLPSQLLTMNRKHVKGIVLETGGLTSHTAILTRAFNIPTVMGWQGQRQKLPMALR